MMTSLFKKLSFFILLCLLSFKLDAIHILIPMDEEGQKEHLKAYGIAYYSIERGITVEWLLNYRGGSFMIPFN